MELRLVLALWCLSVRLGGLYCLDARKGRVVNPGASPVAVCGPLMGAQLQSCTPVVFAMVKMIHKETGERRAVIYHILWM